MLSLVLSAVFLVFSLGNSDLQLLVVLVAVINAYFVNHKQRLSGLVSGPDRLTVAMEQEWASYTYSESRPSLCFECLASPIDDRIYGGESITDDEAFIVAILYPRECTLAILSEQWLLTTSACFRKIKLKNGNEIEMEKLGNGTVTIGEDLALVKMSEPMPDFQRGVFKAIALPDRDEDLTNNAQATIYGLYVTESMVIGHKMNMSLKIGDECKKFYEIPLAKENYICMEITEEKTTCSYDEGALMVVNGKLAGVATVTIQTSFCPSAVTTQTFVKVAAFRDWIHEITNL